MDLYTLIAKAESAENPFAIRYEPHVHKRMKAEGLIKSIRDANRCSRATAEVIYSCSWGLYQIMGFNLYGPLGLVVSVGRFMSDPEMQKRTFKAFCQMNGIWRDGDVDFNDVAWLMKFATAYNGPGAPKEYAARLRDIAGYRAS